MCAAPANLREIHYAPESTFAENAESLASNTYTVRIPVLSFDWRPEGDRIRDLGLRSRVNEENLSHIGPRSATAEFTHYLIGHQTTTAGSLTQTWLQDMLSDALGGGNVSFAGTTVSSATTATSITPTTTSNLAAGMGIRVGAKGDGRAAGQLAIVNSPGSPTTLLTALPGTPSGSDVIYATQVAYHDESTMATLATKRFLVGHPTSPTSGAQFHLLGGQLAGLRFSLPLNGGLPTCTQSWRFAYWGRAAVTIPSSSPTLESSFCGPLTGGSFHIQDVGTTTRNLETPATLDLSIDMGLEPVEGPNCAGSLQYISAWQRTKCQPMLTFSAPWSTTYETLFDLAPASYTYKQILFTGNVADGRGFGFYMPRCFLHSSRPSAPTAVNNQTYVTTNWIGVDSTVTTSELTRSAIRLFTY